MENDLETVEVREDGKLKSKTVNGVRTSLSGSLSSSRSDSPSSGASTPEDKPIAALANDANGAAKENTAPTITADASEVLANGRYNRLTNGVGLAQSTRPTRPSRPSVAARLQKRNAASSVPPFVRDAQTRVRASTTEFPSSKSHAPPKVTYRRPTVGVGGSRTSDSSGSGSDSYAATRPKTYTGGISGIADRGKYNVADRISSYTRDPVGSYVSGITRRTSSPSTRLADRTSKLRLSARRKLHER